MGKSIIQIIKEESGKHKACVILRNPQDNTYLIMREFGYHEGTVPKGNIDHDNPKQAAVRETGEESNIKITRPSDIDYLGAHSYGGGSGKTTLHVFYYEVDEREARTSLRCNSNGTDHNGEEHPEIDQGHGVPKETFLSTLKSSQSKIFTPLLQGIE